MSFWRKEVIDFALDHETRRHTDEQLAWIAREPGNAQPYCNLAQLYRMNGQQEKALGLLLESVRLDGAFYLRLAAHGSYDDPRAGNSSRLQHHLRGAA